MTVQVKLLPTVEQAQALKQTLETVNNACNQLSQWAWKADEFRQFPMHSLFYKRLRSDFPLASQAAIRAIAKVADAYKAGVTKPRVFRLLGSINYDARILAIHVPESTVSIWTVFGRQRMTFVCGEHQRRLLELPKGESDLILRGKQWFLNVTVDVPDASETQALNWLGIDLGLAKIAADSDGRTYGEAKQVAGIRSLRWRQRKRLQKKGTRSARRVLHRLRGRESRFMRHTNHVISKQIVATAERTGRGIALEDLTHIRLRIRAGKSQRRNLHSWAFADLQGKVLYKSKLLGVPVKFVNPRNTSKTCPACGHVAKANRKSQAVFSCAGCGFTDNADTNAARNISRLAVIIPPHERASVSLSDAHVQT